MSLHSPLSTHDLDRLISSIRSAGGDVVAEHLRPGLEPAVVDGIAAPLGLELPAEIKTWFGWRDGAGGYPWSPANGWWSLEQAVRMTESWRRSADRLREHDDISESELWQPSWLAFTGGDRWALFVDCDEAGASSTVYRWQHDEGQLDVRVESVGEVVRIATDLLIRGAYFYEDGWLETVDSNWPDETPNLFD